MNKKLLGICALCFSGIMFSQEKNTEKVKEKKLETVIITKTKKAVEQKADRTIFDISEQAHLNSGNILDGVKKLPGLIVSDVAGMMYQGKQLDVYMDGRPLNISSNELNSFLEGMPANAVERIEIITQPGAEFPATSGGAILNIITSKTAKNYLSATYNGNYSFTNEDKFRSRTNNSINLNARNSLFGWQLSFGQNYREGKMSSFFEDVTSSFNERYNRGYFAKAATTFELGLDRLILNYDYNKTNNNSYVANTETFAGITNLRNDDLHTLGDRHEAAITYQKKFNDVSKKLDFKGTYTKNINHFTQYNTNIGRNALDNTSSSDMYNFRMDYSQPINVLEKGKFSLGGLYERLNFQTSAFEKQNLDYRRQTVSSYAEVQTSYKNFDFIAGARAEDYDISGTAATPLAGGLSENRALRSFSQFRIFPNASIQYNFMKGVYLNLNYNKKITLPSISLLNPNNQNFTNSNLTSTGNPDLLPTIFNNFEVKLSAFDYAFIGYSVSEARNQFTQVLYRNNGVFTNTNLNVDKMRIHNFNVGLPLPLMLFKTGLKEALKFNFNPDKINFFYFYVGYQKHELPDIKTKGFWIANIMGQFILPKDIKMVANYSYLSPGGNYFYFMADRPFSNSLDITFSKKFMNDRLNVSIFANDILNGQKMQLRSTYQNSNIKFGNDWDSRSFGLSVNYKIPTKNRLAKEDPNFLNKTGKEEAAPVVAPTL